MSIVLRCFVNDGEYVISNAVYGLKNEIRYQEAVKQNSGWQGKSGFVGMTWQRSDARKQSQPLQRIRKCSRRILNIKTQKIS